MVVYPDASHHVEPSNADVEAKLRELALILTTVWPVRRALTGESGTMLPAFVDHHVHLHLVDAAGLPRRGVAAVVDLGGDPVALARRGAGLPHVAYAGAFLTVPGGYPTGRSWAPESIVRCRDGEFTASGGRGRRAHGGRRAGGCRGLGHQNRPPRRRGPRPRRRHPGRHRGSARERGLAVVAHAQGDGQVERAIEAGVSALAHAPFDAPLSRRVIARAVAAGQSWISTLDIHRGEARRVAIANVRAFAARGGRVLYGTDLGTVPCRWA